ncbi:uncharacterized protein LOC118436172 [Folsomia candida]|uniref:uncharacterized protein LOC118436172 n=1 Tax=Folsomia candida TaxID=158441 RepID=UPI001605056B|nr:uncharacterized protein LOC118436172 [Folsomia candida]
MLQQCFQEFKQITAGIIIWLLVFPFVAFSVIFLACWKSFVLLYIKLKYKDGTRLFDSLGFMDATFVTNDNDFVCMIAYAFVSDELINLVKLRAHFDDTFIKDGKDSKFPVFHSTFATVLGYKFRMRVPLDLNRHIREEEYDEDTGTETENEAINRIANDKSNLQGPVPKWEIVLLHHTQKGRSTMILKMSHGLVDAYSVRNLVGILTNNKPTYRIPDSAKPRGLLYKTKIFAKLPVLVWNYMKHMKTLNMNIHPYHPVEDKRSVHPPLKPVWSKTTLDFRKLRQIWKQTGCRISPILMSLHASTIRKTLIKLGKWDGDYARSDGPLSCPLPAPNHPADQGNFCTHVSLCTIGIPLRESSRLKQLQTIHDRVEDFEKSEFSSAIMLMKNMFLDFFIPNFLVDKVKIDENAYATTFNPFIFSPLEYNILGARVTNLYFLVHVEGNMGYRGAILTPLTRGDQVDISVFLYDEAFRSMDDADLYTKILHEELELLVKELEKTHRNGSIKEKKVQFLESNNGKS